MSEQTIDQGGAGGAAGTGDGAGGAAGAGGEATRPTETVDFWKAKAREQETRAKANAEKAKKFDDLEAERKTEAEKLTDRATEAERVAADAVLRATRFEVAAEKGLPIELAPRLQGSTKDELLADADVLLTQVGPVKPKAPSLDGGARKTSSGKSDMNDIIRQAAGLTP